jgi:hypothetical protein
MIISLMIIFPHKFQYSLGDFVLHIPFIFNTENGLVNVFLMKSKNIGKVSRDQFMHERLEQVKQGWRLGESIRKRVRISAGETNVNQVK